MRKSEMKQAFVLYPGFAAKQSWTGYLTSLGLEFLYLKIQETSSY